MGDGKVEEGKKNLSVVLGAAFLMATAAVGPSFLTQSATFTEQLGGTFGFVILVALLMSIVVQITVWRVIGVSGRKGPEIANMVFPGLGYVLTFLIVAGCLIFNIGNVAGCALGLNVIFGLDIKIGTVISIILSVSIFLSKEAGKAMDKLTQVLGVGMILLIAFVAVSTRPPIGEALYRTVSPTEVPFMAILTVVGGTVGGYHPFAGGHSLLEGGISGRENLKEVDKSAIIGIIVANLIRTFLFLAVLGVVSKGAKLDPGNPAADAFLQAAGTLGYKFFGIVMLFASVSSVVGASYTSMSFLAPFAKVVREHRNQLSIGFILVSGLIFLFLGKPASLLILTGALNGLVLPVTLIIMLLALRKKEIVGEYRHPLLLMILCVIVTAFMAFAGIRSLSGIAALFH